MATVQVRAVSATKERSVDQEKAVGDGYFSTLARSKGAGHLLQQVPKHNRMLLVLPGIANSLALSPCSALLGCLSPLTLASVVGSPSKKEQESEALDSKNGGLMGKRSQIVGCCLASFL